MPEDPLQALADRLRDLRTGLWPERSITQRQLAQALGASPPLISAWENPTNPTIPPLTRLEAYARFFATERSVAKQPFRLLRLSDLAEQERTRQDDLLRELTALREAAVGRTGIGGFWRFPAQQDITIVCSDPSPDRLRAMPYSDPDHPDFVELFRLTDLDALMELWGHIRAANPANRVRFRTASETTPDDYTTHLVLLGGVDWNRVTRDVLESLKLPVHQLPREPESEIGGFEVVAGDDRKLFTPTLHKIRGREQLVEDVAHVYRGRHPFNRQRTVTICNGMYGRGTLGAARVFTDARFRDRNEAYVRARFAVDDTFSILTRVSIINRKVITPDWTNPSSRLHEWPEVR